MPDNCLIRSNTAKPIFLLLCLVLLIYSNTYNATWHFDDYHNITHNEKVHLKDLSPSSIIDTFFALSNGEDRSKLYRPVSVFSLALNWYFGQNNVWGYHLVNNIIHCLSAIFLYFFIFHVLTLPRINIQKTEKIIFVSLLSATLWAVNPIQTQAVTYIVQRMASLTGMFYILALLFYIKARCYSPTPLKKTVNITGTVFSFVFAFFSKENAVLLPFSIVLVETILIQDLSDPKIRKRLFFLCGATIIIFLIFGFFILKGNLLSFLDVYERRPWSFVERVLTQPRILIFYLSLIFYPVPTRLNLDHDVVVSTSLLSNWSTLPSIFLIIVLIAYAVYKIKYNPLLSFSILFFFLNHSIESSIIALELIFEHRNYIPSMFLFVPVSIGFYKLLEFYKHRKQMYLCLIAFGTLLIIGFGMGTYVRNMVWFSEKRLWEDSIEKNPNSIRSHHNLAYGHYEQIDDYEKAIELYKKGLPLKNNSNMTYKSESYSNIANLYYRQNKYEEARKYYEKSLTIAPRIKSVAGLSLIYAKEKNLEKALENINIVTGSSAVQKGHLELSSEWFTIKGKLLLRNDDVSSALNAFQKSIEIRPSLRGYIGMGTACALSGLSEKGLWFFKQAEKSQPFNTSFYVYFADYYYRMGDVENAKKQILRYILSTPFVSIQSFIPKLHSNLLTIPVHNDIIGLIKEELITQSNSLNVDPQMEDET